MFCWTTISLRHSWLLFKDSSLNLGQISITWFRRIAPTLLEYLPVVRIARLSVSLRLQTANITADTRARQRCHKRVKISAVRIFKISNGIVTSVFDSIRNEHNYSKFSNTYCHQFLTYLTEWRWFFTLATTPSNQQNQQTWSCLRRQCHLKTSNVV